MARQPHEILNDVSRMSHLRENFAVLAAEYAASPYLAHGRPALVVKGILDSLIRGHNVSRKRANEFCAAYCAQLPLVRRKAA